MEELLKLAHQLRAAFYVAALLALCAWLASCAAPIRTEGDVRRIYGAPTAIPAQGFQDGKEAWALWYYHAADGSTDYFTFSYGKVTGHAGE